MLEVSGEELELLAETTSRKRAFEDDTTCSEKTSFVEAPNVASVDVSRKRIKAFSRHSALTNSHTDFVADIIGELPFATPSPVGWNFGVQGTLRTSFGSKSTPSAIMRSQFSRDEFEMPDREDVFPPNTALQRETLSVFSEDNVSSAEHEDPDCDYQSVIRNVLHELKVENSILQDGQKLILKQQSFPPGVSRDSPILAYSSRHDHDGSNATIIPESLWQKGSRLAVLERKPMSQIMDTTFLPSPNAGQMEKLPNNAISQPSIDQSETPEVITDSSDLTKQDLSAPVSINHMQQGLWKLETPSNDSSITKDLELEHFNQRTSLSFSEDRSEAEISQRFEDLSDIAVRQTSGTLSSVDGGRDNVQFPGCRNAKISCINTASTNFDVSNAEKPESFPSDRETFLQQKYFPRHNNAAQVLRCLACASIHHRTWNCSGLSCVLCEDANDHLNSCCPLRQRCERCRELGHLVVDCLEKLRCAKGERVPCDLCGSIKHVESGCDKIWRSYSPRPAEIQTMYELPIYCYSCGASGHFGTECGLHTGPLLSGPRTWTKENYLKYVELSTPPRAKSILSGPIGDGRGQRSFKIRGKANDQNLDIGQGNVNDEGRLAPHIIETAASRASQNLFGSAPGEDFGTDSLLNLKGCSPRKPPLGTNSNHVTPPNFESTTPNSPPFQYPSPRDHLTNQVLNTNLGMYQHSATRVDDQTCEPKRAVAAQPCLVGAGSPHINHPHMSKGFPSKLEARRRGRGGGRRGKSKRLERPA